MSVEGRAPPPDRSIEVCREFTRQRCQRGEAECRYAHPPPYVETHDGRVTCCVDSIKGRCQREKCRYFHPPPHIGDRILSGGAAGGPGFAGRGGPGPGPGAGAVAGAPPPGREGFGGDYNYQIANALRGYKSALDVALAASWLQGGAGGGPPPGAPGIRPGRSDTIEVCREFLRGKCTRPAESCRYAHPPDNINVGADNTVIACIDFIKGRCQRDPCRYFHPPEHLQGRVRLTGGTAGALGRKRPADTEGGGYGGGDYKRPTYDIQGAGHPLN